MGLTKAQLRKAAYYGSIRRKYGLSRDDYDRMRASQGGLCAICRKGRTITLSVDHDHEIQKRTGLIVVRGLLCRRCNSALGKFEWSDEVIKNLISYAQRILSLRDESRN